MTALAADRAQTRRGAEAEPFVLAFGVATATTIYAGSLVAINASGYAVPASDSKALRVVGVARKQVVNSGANGAKSVEVLQGTFLMENSAGADAVVLADLKNACYAADDQTVAQTPSADNSRPVAGIVEDVTSDGVFVRVGSFDRCPARSYQVASLTDEALVESVAQTEVAATLQALPAGCLVIAEVNVTEAFAAAAGAGLIKIGDGTTAALIGSVDAETLGKTTVGPVLVPDSGTLTITFDAGTGEVPADFTAGAATVTAIAFQA